MPAGYSAALSAKLYLKSSIFRKNATDSFKKGTWIGVIIFLSYANGGEI